MINPFIIKGYYSSKYFCDREIESKNLINEIENGNDVAIIATRKIGKTGLIWHCYKEFGLEQRYNLFFIDLYATNSLKEMVYMMSKSIINTLAPTNNKLIRTFITIVKSLSLTLTYDISGTPKFALQIGDIQTPETTLEEIFEYLEHSEKPNIVAIDEFQQIANYPEKNTEALLRTFIQNSHHSTFLFSGSQRHLMGEIFTNANHPFYQSTTVMQLKAIDKEKYKAFAINLFMEANKTLDGCVIDELYERFDGITWYLQKTLNAMFSIPNGDKPYGIETMEEAINNIVESNDYIYAEKMFQLQEKQKELLIAISHEKKARRITSTAFVKKYKLYSTSTIQASSRSLLNKELITEENGEYAVYDKFFDIWLRENY